MGLSEKDLGPEPMASFGNWLRHAERESGQPNPNAMTLCTVGADGWPQGRKVLLKGWDARGFCFYTNSTSEKGQALAAHPQAELLFHWDKLGRQVRARGPVTRLSEAETAAYFKTRPRGGQLGAWASQQSQPIADREALEARYREQEARFQGQEIPVPPYWWGYLLSPLRIEFWQEGKDRLHDRLVYRKEASTWSLTRLCP